MKRSELPKGWEDVKWPCGCGCGHVIKRYVLTKGSNGVYEKKFIKGHGRKLKNKLDHTYPSLSMDVRLPEYCPKCENTLLTKDVAPGEDVPIEVGRCFICGATFLPGGLIQQYEVKASPSGEGMESIRQRAMELAFT